MNRSVGMGKFLLLICALIALSGGCNMMSRAPRKDIVINDGWRFIRNDVDGAQATAFNDRRWQKVTLPHTWNAFDGQDGGNDYYRGPGWYRRTLRIPKEWNRNNIFLRFDGAALVTDVYVNGLSAGQHRGG